MGRKGWAGYEKSSEEVLMLPGINVYGRVIKAVWSCAQKRQMSRIGQEAAQSC